MVVVVEVEEERVGDRFRFSIFCNFFLLVSEKFYFIGLAHVPRIDKVSCWHPVSIASIPA